MLLRQIEWIEKSTFKKIIEDYQRFVKARYGTCTIVFDGYCNKASTKDHEHERRSKTCSTFNINIESTLSVNQQMFLSNDRNKEQLINLLAPSFVADGHVVK